MRFADVIALSLAIADTTVGDEMLLSLQGSIANSDGATERLERGMGLELCYTTDVVICVLCDGFEVVNRNNHVDGGMFPVSQQLQYCTRIVHATTGC